MYSSLRLLILDAEPGDRARAIRALETSFRPVIPTEVADVRALVDALSGNKDYDLVLMEFRLPWALALQVLPGLRYRMPDRPVILMTSVDELETAVMAMKDGVDDYLVKSPRGYVQLATAARAAMVARQAGRETLAAGLARERLREARLRIDAVRRLAATVVQDLEGPLSALEGAADKLSERLGPGQEGGAEINALRMAAGQARQVSRDLRAFAQQKRLQPRAIDLNAVLLESEARLRDLVGLGIDLSTTSDPGSLWVFCDPEGLDGVFETLVLAARQRMPRGGTLKIGMVNERFEEPDPHGEAAGPVALRTGRYAVVSFEDDGDPFESGQAARMFEPGGWVPPMAGLRLSAAFGFIRQSGGHLSAEEMDGRGARFRIRLPLHDWQGG